MRWPIAPGSQRVSNFEDFGEPEPAHVGRLGCVQCTCHYLVHTDNPSSAQKHTSHGPKLKTHPLHGPFWYPNALMDTTSGPLQLCDSGLVLETWFGKRTAQTSPHMPPRILAYRYRPSAVLWHFMEMQHAWAGSRCAMTKYPPCPQAPAQANISPANTSWPISFRCMFTSCEHVVVMISI